MAALYLTLKMQIAMIEVTELDTGTLSVKASGKLTHEDYIANLIPTIEKNIDEHEKISLLIELSDFDGWEWKAAFDDFKTGIKHRKDFVKVALVGNMAWEKYIVQMFDYFIDGEVRYFDERQLKDARIWITQ